MEHPFNSDQFKNWSRFEPDKPENIQGFNVFYLVLVFVYFPNERKNKLQASKIVTFNSYWGIPRRYWFWVIQWFKSSMLIPARALEVISNDSIIHVRTRPVNPCYGSGIIWIYIQYNSSRQLYPHAVEFIFFHISIQDAPNDAHNNRFVETILKSPPQPLN